MKYSRSDINFVQYALLGGGDATKNVYGETPENFSLFHDFLPLFRENLWLMLTWVTDGNIDQWTPRTKSFPGEGSNLQTVVGILVKARERCGEITAEHCRISQIFSLVIVNLYLVTSDYALLKFFRHWQPRKFDAVGASRTSGHVARRALRHWNFSIRFTQGCSFKVLTGLATVHFNHDYTYKLSRSELLLVFLLSFQIYC